MSAHLGIDVGGTASRWVACDETGAVLARGQAAGATGHIFNPVEKERLRLALVSIAQALGAAGLATTSITIGLTGYGSAVAAEVEALIAAVFMAGPGSIIITDDIVLAYMANFAPGEGHLISAGTGSIGLHISADSSFVRVGGRGILIDDAGSGSWIALRALDLLYRAQDHNGSFDVVATLAQHMFNAIGGAEWHAVRQFIYAGDRGRIGTLAVAVARAAHDGDLVATTILRDAAAELARLAQALIARAGHHPVGVIGGVLKLHPLITEEIQRLLPDADIRLLNADAALAAAQLQTSSTPGWRQVLAARTSIG
ncbi:N-acetylglucosamine kinase [Devosia sp. A449]